MLRLDKINNLTFHKTGLIGQWEMSCYGDGTITESTLEYEPFASFVKWVVSLAN